MHRPKSRSTKAGATQRIMAMNTFRYVPCASVWNKCDCNHSELVEYFKTNATEEQIPGYISAPWGSVTKEDKYRLEDTFRFYKEAMDKHYKE